MPINKREDQFKWESIESGRDHRAIYLGNSLLTLTGWWQKGKNLLARKFSLCVLLVYACFCYSGLSRGLFVGAKSCNISAGELNALEALFDATSGGSWAWGKNDTIIDNTVWTFPASLSDPCTNNWQGITCILLALSNVSCYIENLVLNNFMLQGSLPSKISDLTSLSILDLQYNSITSTIPSQLSYITSLQELNLRNNLLRGNISNTLLNYSNMTNLGKISLSYNFFSGRIPNDLPLKLNYLGLGNNELTGNIASQLSKLTGLTSLFLYNNMLTGTVPIWLSILTGLTYLQLNGNLLYGTVPSQLSKLTGLTLLALDTNKLQGTIPYQLSQLSKMQILYLNKNRFTGTVPVWLGAFTDLELLYLGDNDFKENPFPDIFSSLSGLQALSLNSIKLSGTLPISLKNSNTTLTLLDVSNNKLSGGDPFFFLGFPKIVLVNISNNRFDDDISNLKSNRTPLTVLDISNNKLKGSLPSEIGILFPYLNILSASNNCLQSYIPTSLCSSSNLTTLLLNKLGSQCLSNRINNMFVLFSNFYVIPSCVLQLPKLQTAHFVSNALYGSLSDIGPDMASLSLVGNLLVGTIPKSIQTSYKLNNLQLSLNRLTGTLLDNAFASMNSGSKIDLYSNRISGQLPSSLHNISEIDILTGNLFNCSEPPKNDIRHATYSCGTSSFNYYESFYIAVGIAFLLVAAYSFSMWYRYKRNSNDGYSKKLQVFVKYFNTQAFPSKLFLSLVSLPFLCACLSVALLMIFINLGMNSLDKDLDFKNSYSIVVFRYGWASTFVYVHGVLPYLLVIFGTSFLLCIHLKYFEKDGSSCNRSDDDVVSASSKEIFACSSPTTSLLSSTTTSSSAAATANSNSIFSSYWAKLLSLYKSTLSFILLLVNSKENMTLVALQLFNIVLVTGVNVLYVFVEDETDQNSKFYMKDSSYKKLVPIALGAFKTLWANTYIYYLAQYGVLSKISLQNVFFNYFFAMVYIMILVPIVTVYFTDVDCFYYPLFQNIEKITENYTGVNATLYCIDPSCLDIGITIADPTPISQKITPTWIYNFHCGFTILTNYIPALLAAYSIRGILLPVFKLLLLLYSPRKNLPLSSSNWLRSCWITKKMIPFNVNNGTNDHEDIMADRQLRTINYMITKKIDVLMLLTYGIICPFMSFIIIFTIVVNEFVEHMQIGSYLCYRASTTVNENVTSNVEEGANKAVILIEEGIKKVVDAHSNISKKSPSLIKIEFIKQIDLTSNIYLDSTHHLDLSIWKANLIVISFFLVLILFDMIADIYSSTGGIVAVSMYILWIWLLFWDRLEKISYFIAYLNSKTTADNDSKELDDSTKCAIHMEMNSSNQ